MNQCPKREIFLTFFLDRTLHLHSNLGKANDYECPTCSHDHRFESKNARSRSNLFHVTMTWKSLGLNRHKTNLR